MKLIHPSDAFLRPINVRYALLPAEFGVAKRLAAARSLFWFLYSRRPPQLHSHEILPRAGTIRILHKKAHFHYCHKRKPAGLSSITAAFPDRVLPSLDGKLRRVGGQHTAKSCGHDFSIVQT